MKTMKAIGTLVLATTWCVLTAGAAQPPAQPATAPSTQPTKELTLDMGNKVTMKLVLIPAGKFMMGSPNTEKYRDTNEAQHEVTISRAFYMGVTHVTVDQFAAFVKDSGYKTDPEKDGGAVVFEIEDGKLMSKKVDGASWRKPSFDQKGDHPVVLASWNDAKAFCDWLSKKSGKTVVLPTEARFEYACRARAKTEYPWGDSPDDGKGWANCADQGLKKKLPNAPAAFTFFSWDDGFVFTSPVGSFKANAFGLYDMIGNAWEWCSDWYDKDYYPNSPKTDPQGPASRPSRVLRGGSWGNSPRHCRSAGRGWGAPDGRGSHLGFRVVLDLPTDQADLNAAPSRQPATVPGSFSTQPSSQPAKELALDMGNKVTTKLVLIPAGKFMMGSPAHEKDRWGREGPQHEVTISKAFYMGIYDVTQEQYERIMGKNPSSFRGAQNPVDNVSWSDAAEFCIKLSQKTGSTVRLPTEAQWEYACRAGSKTRFSYGDDNDYSNLGDYAWYIKNCNGQTHPVGQKKPNAWGLYDMHGNVWQWCSDWYADSYANAGKTDPSGSASGSFRVLRGGDFVSPPKDCRSASRGSSVPGIHGCNDGFRVVMDLPTDQADLNAAP